MTSENATGNLNNKLSMPELILLLLSTLTVMAGATIAPALPTLQANFVKKQWENIEANHHGATGTSLGGIYFEWLDEWWKAPTDAPDIHTREGGWDAPTFDSGTRESGNEEWWGICAQAESGEDSPNYRHLRELYYVFKRLWTK